MKTRLTTVGINRLSAFLLAYLASGSAVLAAPGNLSQTPLFLQMQVEPNIFILSDDSSSMAGELLTSDNTSGAFLTATSDNQTPVLVDNPACSDTSPTYEYIVQEGSNANACTTVAEEEWRARFSAYNKLYYDPSKTYLPWPGTKSDGSPRYENSHINAAPLDPDQPSVTLNLLENSGVLGSSGHNYYDSAEWTTWCGNQGIPAATCRGWRYYSSIGGTKQMAWVHDLSTTDQTNFANWFTYHRKREYVTKYAIGSTIARVEHARIGYGTLNERANDVAVDWLTDAYRSNLLDKVFGTQPIADDTTPLRQGLQGVGIYYERGSLFGTYYGSPILPEDAGGACQSNNAIVMSDGYYNGGSPNVGNIDGDNGKPFADGIADTLADVAMHYYERDLADGLPGQARNLPNIISPSSKDPATYQHLNTYTVAFGLTGTIDPTQEDINADSFGWPDPQPNQSSFVGPQRIDDLFHAAVNGHANYLNAQDPDTLVQALTETVQNIATKTQSATSVASSSFRLTQGSQLFTSRFNSADWSGDLLSYTINANGELNASPDWHAANKLDAQSSRTILTYKNGTGIPFTWNSLSQSQKDALIAGYSDSDIGPARLSYLRGDSYDNKFSFRKRSTLLGDIVHSSPIYVGSPAMLIGDTDPYGKDGERYSSFRSQYNNRTPVVYTGANDGMLHGFRADTGEEVLAYVPDTVIPNLYKLTNNTYYAHHYFVDLSPSVTDAYFGKAGSTNENWYTVLVGGLGAGGRGLFALDITDPSQFLQSSSSAKDTVLWEFNSNDDSDLGYTLSKPVIALTNDGWKVIVGNGYNSNNGVAKLFIINLDAKLSGGHWQEGTDYIKISTGVGSSTSKNGLSSPAVADTDGDGYIDRVYAGDLEGNLWAFDLSDTNTAHWDVAYKNGTAPRPLFQAKSAAGDIQPITTRPSLIRHPYQPTIATGQSNATEPNLMIFFGTGQHLVANDLFDTKTQTFYGIWDKGQAVDQNGNQLDRDNLTVQTIITGTDTSLGIEARLTSENDVPYYDDTNIQRFGWLLDLDKSDASTGERVIANATVLNDIVFFTTYTPPPSSAPCSAGGSSWFMFVKAVNGGMPSKPVINVNNDSVVDDTDTVSLSQNGQTTSSAAAGLKTDAILSAPSLGVGTGGNSDTANLNTVNGTKSLKADFGRTLYGKRISWGELRRE